MTRESARSWSSLVVYEDHSNGPRDFHGRLSDFLRRLSGSVGLLRLRIGLLVAVCLMLVVGLHCLVVLGCMVSLI